MGLGEELRQAACAVLVLTGRVPLLGDPLQIVEVGLTLGIGGDEKEVARGCRRDQRALGIQVAHVDRCHVMREPAEGLPRQKGLVGAVGQRVVTEAAAPGHVEHDGGDLGVAQLDPEHVGVAEALVADVPVDAVNLAHFRLRPESPAGPRAHVRRQVGAVSVRHEPAPLRPKARRPRRWQWPASRPWRSRYPKAPHLRRPPAPDGCPREP